MSKVAIFVEGQAELIFVREYLLKYFEYQDIAIACFSRIKDGNFKSADYAFPNPLATHVFEILNVGGDTSVLSTILSREQSMWRSGFDRIIGLRDMYSQDYRKATQSKTIDQDIIEKFRDGHRATITKKAINQASIRFHFAIMEIEAWMIGMGIVDGEFDSSLDPEDSYFHPAAEVERKAKEAGSAYGKSKEAVDKFMGRATKSHFEALLASSFCRSFQEFHHSVIAH